MATENDLISTLNLKPLAEVGGYYRETFRGENCQASRNLFGLKKSAPRSIISAGYLLITKDSFAAFHKLNILEIYHFYCGDAVEMVQIDEKGHLARAQLGHNIFSGETQQITVKKGTWQALRLKANGHWALLGSTVAPGFENPDYELGDRTKMRMKFPEHSDEIQRLTR